MNRHRAKLAIAATHDALIEADLAAMRGAGGGMRVFRVYGADEYCARCQEPLGALLYLPWHCQRCGYTRWFRVRREWCVGKVDPVLCPTWMATGFGSW